MKNILLMALILPTLLLSACTTETITVTAPPSTVTVIPPTVTIIAPTVTAIPPTVTVTITPLPETITIMPPPITITVTPPPPTQPQEEYEVVDFDYKITEKDLVSWTFSWKVTVRNNTSRDLRLTSRINFVDNEGF